jgi:hypothetical protein
VADDDVVKHLDLEELAGTGEVEMQTKSHQEKPRPNVLAGVGVVWTQLK